MNVYAVVLMFMVVLGAFSLAYQVFRLISLDAESRGLKHPKFWGLFSLSGGNGSGGLLLYLFGRKKYPSEMTEEQKKISNSRKKRAGISLCFIAFGTIFLIVIGLFGNL